MTCWAHPDSPAVACGTFTRRGYCCVCWPEDRRMPLNALSALEAAFWPNTPDAALWLAS